ncbi:hypothetical protein [Accumulibacter sp.]|uniref:hypothetical protein n=1 Tax=Accumulibacter sp. TaxID=2053492 RepID=UPI00260FCF19|nr:hypothetical protein [Accumulibacter sp.]
MAGDESKSLDIGGTQSRQIEFAIGQVDCALRMKLGCCGCGVRDFKVGNGDLASLPGSSPKFCRRQRRFFRLREHSKKPLRENIP